MVDNNLVIVITIWKDNNTLQVFINTITKCFGQFNRIKANGSVTVKLSNYIITYQKHMCRLDHGYQNRVMGTGSSNLSQFLN